MPSRNDSTDQYRCPLTQAIIRHPIVALQDGHFYELSAFVEYARTREAHEVRSLYNRNLIITGATYTLETKSAIDELEAFNESVRGNRYEDYNKDPLLKELKELLDRYQNRSFLGRTADFAKEQKKAIVLGAAANFFCTQKLKQVAITSYQKTFDANSARAIVDLANAGPINDEDKLKTPENLKNINIVSGAAIESFAPIGIRFAALVVGLLVGTACTFAFKALATGKRAYFMIASGAGVAAYLFSQILNEVVADKFDEIAKDRGYYHGYMASENSPYRDLFNKVMEVLQQKGWESYYQPFHINNSHLEMPLFLEDANYSKLMFGLVIAAIGLGIYSGLPSNPSQRTSANEHLLLQRSAQAQQQDQTRSQQDTQHQQNEGIRQRR